MKDNCNALLLEMTTSLSWPNGQYLPKACSNFMKSIVVRVHFGYLGTLWPDRFFVESWERSGATSWNLVLWMHLHKFIRAIQWEWIEASIQTCLLLVDNYSIQNWLLLVDNLLSCNQSRCLLNKKEERREISCENNNINNKTVIKSENVD